MIIEYYVAAIGTLITIVSIVFNILQFMQKKYHISEARRQVQTNYNLLTQISRAVGKIRDFQETDGSDAGEAFYYLMQQVQKIDGITDAGRTDLISYGREALGFIPKYEHPLYPGKDMPWEVMHGDSPRTHMLKTEDRNSEKDVKADV
jgi:hypothetical protein